VIDLGDKRRVVLHGRIDRINCIAAGQYEVVDYKTGGYWADAWKGEFAGGTRLQHALYGLAALPLLTPQDSKARIVRGVYLFTAVKGHRLRKVIKAPPKTKVVAVLRI
jgi:RecB family exonuclease